MYLSRVEIKNIRSIERFWWDLVDGMPRAGWHVILGDNGSGKSTVLRSIALALVGPQEAHALRQNWEDWLRRGQDSGSADVCVGFDDAWDQPSGKGNNLKTWFPSATVTIDREANRVTLSAMRDGPSGKPERHVWGGKRGWFSAAYGPFRRFSGGDKDVEKIYFTDPRLARHLTLFGEGVALTECLAWLKTLHHKALEQEKRGVADGGEPGKMMRRLIAFVNNADLLPHGARMLEINSDRVLFVDGNGTQIAVEELSDGFRSILSLTFELIRQLEVCYGSAELFDPADPSRVVAPGVVLIDEVDVHLHPTWQRRIGHWFIRAFPNVQFIVATHSALVCQAAAHGTIYRLSSPGEPGGGRFVTGLERERLIHGNILEALDTDSFGHVETRSDEGQELLARLAELDQRALQATLSPDERAERDRLRAAFPTGE
jgi:energy-coupling factor transporter ATP-binding protein EcfA2